MGKHAIDIISHIALPHGLYEQNLCMWQGKKIQQAYMDICKLARPVFNGIGADVLACEARIDSKVLPVLQSGLQCIRQKFRDMLLTLITCSDLKQVH